MEGVFRPLQDQVFMLIPSRRTFFDGDDPFWTAVDLHYWPTG